MSESQVLEKLDALIQSTQNNQPKPKSSLPVLVFIFVFSLVYLIWWCIRYFVKPNPFSLSYFRPRYISMKTKVNKVLDRLEQLEQKQAQHQAKNILKDPRTGIIYGACDYEGGPKLMGQVESIIPADKWVELHGHFVQVFARHHHVGSLHVMPYESVAQIMNRLSLEDGSILVYKEEQLQDFDKTLLDYGIPDNRRILLKVMNLEDVFDDDSLSSF